MPEVHAILSASSSKRWLNCTPSARLEQNFPNESSVYAEEGTAAHALGEYKLRKYLHERIKRPTSEFDNEEMDANTDIYAEFIISTVERIKETCAHPLVMVEERLDYSYLVPQGFGTGDCVIIADDTLYVMDYKNGKGVFVSCDHNPQMMLYALGAYHAYGYLYSITKVSMTIIQPRLENISTFECSVEELLNWAESYVRPRAKLAFEGKGKQVPGDWCRFCRARTSCKACAAEAMALVKTEFLDLDAGVLADEQEETDATASYDPDTTAPTFKSPALLSKADIEKMLPTLNRIESWIEAIFAYVSSEAINHGVCWDGYKVVEGRSKRQFLDLKAVATAVTKKIEIDGQMVEFRASAAVPRLYRIKFGRDIYKDLRSLEKSVGDNDEESSSLDLFSLEMFENIAYIMAKHAHPDQVPDTPDEWLENFNTFSIYQILPQLIELWGLNVQTEVEARKNLAKVSG